MKIFYLLAFIILSSMNAHAGDDAPVSIKIGKKFIAVNNLPDGAKCKETSEFKLSGKIIGHRFGDDNLRLEEIIVESSEGNRELINVDLDDVERDWGVAGITEVVPALQAIAKVGQKINATIYKSGPSCAPKDIIYLKNIKLI